MGVSGLESTAGDEASVTLENVIAKDVCAKVDNVADDREEGEIVDDFEFIISSDEEITMRERIKELEATNEELEQIAIISESYSNKYNIATKNITAPPTLDRNLTFNEITNNKDDRRPTYVLTDASSISSVEFATPKKRKRKKKKVCNKSSQILEEQQPLREYYSRQQNCHRLQRHNHHYQNNNNKQHHDKHSHRYECRKRRQHSSWQTLPNGRRHLRNELELDSYDSSEVDDTREPADDREEGFMYLNRAELRFALARSSYEMGNGGGGVGGSLKERLQNEARHKTSLAAERVQRHNRSKDGSIVEDEVRSTQPVTTQFIAMDDVEEAQKRLQFKKEVMGEAKTQVDQVDKIIGKAVEEMTASDGSISLEEQELRLIALKSAVLNKHAVRKQRDAEQAYSPTDFEDMLAVNADSNMDVVDVNELNEDDVDEYLIAGMEISPVASPKLHLSPAVLDAYEDDFVINMEGIVDTKPIDMDIANSESENDNVLLQSLDKWMPIEQIPLPRGGGATTYDAIDYLPNTSAGLNFGVYMPEVLFEQTHLPPPPPGVTDYEEVPPPPPPFIRDMQSESDEDMQSCSENEQSNCSVEWASDDGENKKPSNRHNAQDTPALLRSEESLSKKSASLCSVSQDNSKEDCCALQHYPEHEANAPENADDDEEEEAEALRALLLSKFNSSKTSKATSTDQAKNITSPLLNAKPVLGVISSEESEDPESLRSLLLTSMLRVQPSSSRKPAESILKDAVHRLKMKSYSENSHDDSAIMHNKLRNLPKSIENSATHSNEYVIEDNNTSQKNKCSSVGPVVSGEELLGHVNACALAQDETEKNKIIEDNILDISIDLALMAKIQIEETTEQELAAGDKHEAKRHDIKRKLEANTLDAKKDKDYLAIETPSSSSHKNISELRFKTAQNNTNVAIKTKMKSTSALKTTKDSENSPANLLRKDLIPPASQKNEISQSKDSAFSVVTPTPAATLPVALHIVQRESAKSTLNALSNFKLNTLPSDLPLRPTKIIKPNKIINTNPELKRNSLEYAKVNKKLKTSNTTSSLVMPNASVFPNTIVSASAATKSGSRLITSANLPAVKKLIITLRKSDTETSEDEAVYGCKTLITKGTVVATSLFESSDNLTCTINNNYYDNASPISLQMESPGTTPVRTNSPSADSGDSNAAKSLVNDFFEKKLDNFLRDVRSKVQNSSLVAATTTPTPTPKSVQNKGQFTTPVSVRHLPEAAQKEYRSLVNRMKMLEKQKKSKKSDSSLALFMRSKNSQNESPTSSTANSIDKTKDLTVSSNTQASLEQVVLTTSTIKRNLIKEVLIKNANSSKTRTTSREPTSKVNVLREYENSFAKLSSGIISNLDKSLKLVEEAKTVKIVKLQHEQRLKELRAEMDEVQRKFKHQQQRFSNILPQISVGNEVLTTLKQKHSKLFKSVTNLGKNIKGEDYRLNNEVKHEISFKSKKLAAQIKVVNSIKYNDTKNLEQGNVTTCDKGNTKDNVSQTKSEQSKEPRAESIKEEFIADKAKHLKLDELVVDDLSKEVTTLTEDFSNPKNHQHGEIAADLQGLPNEEEHRSGQKSTTDILEEVRVQAVKENHQMEEEVACLSAEKIHKMIDQQKSINNSNEAEMLSEYISPLEHLRNNESQLDPNGVICPYELMGQCEDNDCSYMHLTRKKTKAV